MIKKKKPVAARGKTTKKEAVKRSMKKALRGLAMGAPAGLAKRIRSVSPGMKKAMTGSATGMGGAGLMAMARKIKKTGEISPKDLMRMKAAMGKKTGGMAALTPELKKIFDRMPAKGKTKTPAGMKVVLDSKGNPVKNLFQKDNSPKRKMRGMQMQRPKPPRRMPKLPPKNLVRKRIVGRKIK
jgi:hypothetical protein